MKIITKQIKIDKTLNADIIETALKTYGEPLRWAIVKVLEKEYLIEAVFTENN